MSNKIIAVEISHFRGIPRAVRLEFCGKDKVKANSLLLFGDNGSGKSSFVDAIECGLQARIDRSKNLLSKSKPLPISLTGKGPAQIDIQFADSTKIHRILSPLKNSKGVDIITINNDKAHPAFALAPVALRRHDILRFIETPSHERQTTLFGYISPNVSKNEDAIEDEQVIQERLDLKEKRRDLIQTLSRLTSVSEEIIPFTTNGIDNFITNYIYKGLTKQDRQRLARKGTKITFNKRALDIAIEIRQISIDIQKLKRNIINKPAALNVGNVTRQFLETIFSDAGEDLTKSFKQISLCNFFDRIELIISDKTAVSFDILVHLKDGQCVPPNNIFSEANLDLLSLLIFVAIIGQSSIIGQEKFIILDDVLQSVDASMRLRFIDYLLTAFNDWQFLITIHDRLFLNQIKSLFWRHGHPFVDVEILKWSFSEGPLLIKKDQYADTSLLTALKTNDVNLIVSQAGLLLEKMCNHLSVSLPTSVTRRKDDKYTLGDLWTGIYKKLKNTSMKETVNNIDMLSSLRNLFGAHYNEWALSLSNSEILLYAETIQHLYQSVFCDVCFSWVGIRENGNLACTCGAQNIK